MIFREWGPVKFSHLKGGGVTALWRPASFLHNALSDRAICACSSGNEKLDDSECLVRIQMWIGYAYFLLTTSGEVSLQLHHRTTARGYTTPLADDVKAVMRSGPWTNKEVDEC